MVEIILWCTHNKFAYLYHESCTVGHKSHDTCFHVFLMEAGVMTFVAHCTVLYNSLMPFQIILRWYVEKRWSLFSENSAKIAFHSRILEDRTWINSHQRFHKFSLRMNQRSTRIKPIKHRRVLSSVSSLQWKDLNIQKWEPWRTRWPTSGVRANLIVPTNQRRALKRASTSSLTSVD